MDLGFFGLVFVGFFLGFVFGFGWFLVLFLFFSGWLVFVSVVGLWVSFHFVVLLFCLNWNGLHCPISALICSST